MSSRKEIELKEILESFPIALELRSQNRLIYFSNYNLGRGPKRKLFEGEKCQICSENGTGFNYGALTCNPCKSFFRRTILENKLSTVWLRIVHKILILNSSNKKILIVLTVINRTNQVIMFKLNYLIVTTIVATMCILLFIHNIQFYMKNSTHSSGNLQN